MRNRLATLAFASLALLVVTPGAFAQRGKDRAEVAYGPRADVRAFAAEVASETGLDRARVERVLAGARFQPRVVALMSKPIVEPPKWFEYAPTFLTPSRVSDGVAWWRANDDALRRAEAKWGVPPEIVVAIVGVETNYGRLLGGFRVLDALATLAFDYPRRAPFFRGELKEFLLLAREQGFSPFTPKGSYAGAMGVPQFMPGSFRRYAVDFDGDTRIDLWTSGPDVVGSVANYLARHDWQPGGVTIAPAAIDPLARDGVLRKLDGGLSERRSLDAWAADGVRPSASLGTVDDPVGLLLLEEADGGSSTWIAGPNFYVVTRYNRSRLYATAVIRLAEAIRSTR